MTRNQNVFKDWYNIAFKMKCNQDILKDWYYCEFSGAGTAYPSGALSSRLVLSGVRVNRSLFLSVFVL